MTAVWTVCCMQIMHPVQVSRISQKDHSFISVVGSKPSPNSTIRKAFTCYFLRRNVEPRPPIRLSLSISFYIAGWSFAFIASTERWGLEPWNQYMRQQNQHGLPYFFLVYGFQLPGFLINKCIYCIHGYYHRPVTLETVVPARWNLAQRVKHEHEGLDGSAVLGKLRRPNPLGLSDPSRPRKLGRVTCQHAFLGTMVLMTFTKKKPGPSYPGW